MKIIELATGVNIVISNEESLLLMTIKDNNGMIHKKQLDERQQLVAANLVKRDVLTRAKKDGKICYMIQDLSNVWRI